MRFLSGDRGVGLLLVAQRLIDAANQLVGVLSMAFFPYISNLAATRRDQALALFRRATGDVIPFGLLALGIFAFAPLAIRILVGDSMRPRYRCFRMRVNAGDHRPQ